MGATKQATTRFGRLRPRIESEREAAAVAKALAEGLACEARAVHVPEGLFGYWVVEVQADFVERATDVLARYLAKVRALREA